MAPFVPSRFSRLAGPVAFLFVASPALAVQVFVEGYTAPVQIHFSLELETAAGDTLVDSLDVTGPRLGMAGLYTDPTRIVDAHGFVDPHLAIAFHSSADVGTFFLTLDLRSGTPRETRILDLSYMLPFELRFTPRVALHPLDVLDDTLEGTFRSRAFSVHPSGQLGLFVDDSLLASRASASAFGSLVFGMRADPAAGFAFVRGEPEVREYFVYEIDAASLAVWLGGTLVESDFHAVRFTTQIEVPEPSHSLLLATALGCIGALRRLAGSSGHGIASEWRRSRYPAR